MEAVGVWRGWRGEIGRDEHVASPPSPAAPLLSLSLFILSDLIVNDMLIVNEAGLAWRPLCVLMWTCSGSGQGAATRLMFTSLHVLQLTYICPLLEKTQDY